MPDATFNPAETERKDLKSLPGAYVELRRMTYGQTLERRALMKLSISTRKGQKDLTGEMAMANRRIQEYEFKHCIVEHNLTDSEEKLLDLKNPVVLQKLHPRVGQEIEGYISDMNNFEDDDEDDDSGN